MTIILNYKTDYTICRQIQVIQHLFFLNKVYIRLGSYRQKEKKTLKELDQGLIDEKNKRPKNFTPIKCQLLPMGLDLVKKTNLL